MNIAIGKLGRTIKFDTTKHGAVGGDNEPPLLYNSLARQNPENTYYLIGRSDRSRTTVDIPSNIVDVWKDFNKNIHDKDNWVIDYFATNNITIDAGILINGPGQESQPEVRQKRDVSLLGTRMETMKNYTAPLVRFLNHSKIKWVMLVQDPRYSKLGRDVFNQPVKVLGQYNETIKQPLLKSFDIIDQHPDNIGSVDSVHTYSAIETVFLIDKPAPLVNRDRSIKFMMVLNEGLGRYRELKKYVLDSFEDVEIYGQWKHQAALDDQRFKGAMPFHVLQDKLDKVKYTFIIPIKEGWVTSKVWEMIYNGVIPFMHPTYDMQQHIPVHEFIRVKSPEDLLNKINYLERNPDKYQVLLNELIDTIKPEHLSGTYLNKILHDAIK